jgi:hypothetical protein
MSRKVLYPVGHGNNHQVVPPNVVTLLVEHEAPFSSRTQKVHAGVAQFLCVHRVEVRGIEEVNRRHTAKIRTKLQIYANCENIDAFRENKDRDKLCNFAVSDKM